MVPESLYSEYNDLCRIDLCRNYNKWTHVDVSLVDLINDNVTDASDSCFKLPQQNTWNTKHTHQHPADTQHRDNVPNKLVKPENTSSPKTLLRGKTELLENSVSLLINFSEVKLYKISYCWSAGCFLPPLLICFGIILNYTIFGALLSKHCLIFLDSW